jgi:hypothetical protein
VSLKKDFLTSNVDLFYLYASFLQSTIMPNVKSLFWCLMICLISFNAFAQKPTSIDLEAIESEVTNKKSRFFYPLLTKKLYKFEPLSQEELIHLYYGLAYTSSYKPYFTDPRLKLSVEHLRNKDWNAAINPSLEVWKSDPVNLEALYYLMIAHHESGDTTNAANYGRLFYRFVDLIYESGDGLSAETAFVVNRVSDEYTMMQQMELGISSQTLVGTTDKMTLSKPIERSDISEEPIEHLYFNVYQPFTHMSESLNTSSKKKKRKRKKR